MPTRPAPSPLPDLTVEPPAHTPRAEAANGPLLVLPASLPVARYRLHWLTQTPIRFKDYAGSALRGVYGHALKRLACVTGHADCKACPQYRRCQYTTLFEPPPPEQTYRRYSEIAAPAVIEAPEALALEPGQPWSFDLVLLGPALASMPLILLAWQQALQRGVGEPAGRAVLTAVTHDGHPLLDERGHLVPQAGSERLGPLPTWSRRGVPAVRLTFLTPLRIKRQGQVLRPQDLRAADLLMAVLRRCADTCEQHLGMALQADFAGLRQVAQTVTLTQTLRWRDWDRYSNRQGRHMPLGGLVGTVTLQGEGLRHFWPLLHLGQMLHIGGKATFGLGHYHIDTWDSES